jgi:aspartate carbamoyltransferase catalytic subunit
LSGFRAAITHSNDSTTSTLHAYRRLQHGAVAGTVAAGAAGGGDPGNFTDAWTGNCINLFYEASTRTRVSFETAAKRLGMHVINVGASGSSIEKGETLHDTFFTLQAMQPDFVVCATRGRHCRDLASRAEPGTRDQRRRRQRRTGAAGRHHPAAAFR